MKVTAHLVFGGSTMHHETGRLKCESPGAVCMTCREKGVQYALSGHAAPNQRISMCLIKCGLKHNG